MPIKGRSRALVREGWPRGGMGWRIRLSLSLSLSLSLADACNPLLQAHPTWAQDNMKVMGFPFFLSPFPPPLRALSRADPSGLGHVATIYSSVQGPPGVKTPTVGAPGRGLLRVDEQLPVKLQMGSLQQPFQPETVLRFRSLHVPRRRLRHDTPSSAARQRQWRSTACPPAAESMTSSPRGGRTTFGFVPSPPPPTEEEAGQPWPSRRRHLVGCRASRRHRRPNGGHVGRRPRV
jgi:hypothetical protein